MELIAIAAATPALPHLIRCAEFSCLKFCPTVEIRFSLFQRLSKRLINAVIHVGIHFIHRRLDGLIVGVGLCLVEHSDSFAIGVTADAYQRLRRFVVGKRLRLVKRGDGFSILIGIGIN